MRKRFLLFAVIVLGGAGCGKSGPADPAKLTPEQIEAANQEQKKTNDAERAHQKAEPGNKKGPGDSINEEERRARGGR